MFSPKRNGFAGEANAMYAYGNTSPRDVLEAFHLDAYEGDLIKILYLACGDLRNALFTLAERPVENNNTFHIHVNDIDPLIIARNILIIKVLTADSFENKDVDYVVDLWYNLIWKDVETRQRFIEDVTKLINTKLPEQIVVSDKKQMEQLKVIWTRWLKNSTSAESADVKLIKKQLATRASEFYGTLVGYAGKTLEEMLEVHSEHWLNVCISKDSPLVPKVKQDIELFMRTGTLDIRADSMLQAVNPTLLTLFTNKCPVHFTCFPYFLMRPPTSEEENVEPSVRFRATLYRMISSYRAKRDKIKFFFDASDALEFCFTVPTTFDVIHSSNVADHIGLANVLIAAQKILADKETSLLLTQSMSWTNLKPTLIDYIETALCVPVTMIPTIYGLQLTNRLELGSPKLDSSIGVASAVDFMWRKAPSMDVPFDSTSPELHKCLDQLKQRCFILKEGPLWKDVQHFGMHAYSPMTLNYLMSSLEKRLHLTNVPAVEVHPVFRLSYRALSDWSQGYPVSLMTLSIRYEDDVFNVRGTNDFFLRLVLMVPPFETSAYTNIETILEAIKNPPSSENSGLHFIDNFQMNMVKKEGRIEEVEIKFLFPIDHGLHPSSGLMVVYVAQDWPVGAAEFQSISEEIFTATHPYLLSKEVEPPSATEIIADSCLESKSGFIINCHFDCEDGGALKVEAAESFPAESSHQILMSFAEFQSTPTKTLRITLPHPVLCSSVNASINRKQKTIRVVAVKAVREPWPVEFTAVQQKWDVSDLRQWPKDEDIKPHMSAQFPLDYFMKVSLSPNQEFDPANVSDPAYTFDPANPLQGIRKLIATVVDECLAKNTRMFSINHSQDGLWLFRVYQPILISDLGCPILPISAVDIKLLERLQGKHDPDVARADFERIFGSQPEDGYTISLVNQEEAEILRYVLRLNSTRMSWKDHQLTPRSNNMTILTTYLSPLYEASVSKDRWNETIVPRVNEALNKVGISPKPSQKQQCAKCGIRFESLKQCSRCKKTFYCSSLCQKADWKQHKKRCVA